MKLSVFRFSFWNRRGSSFKVSHSLDPSFDGGYVSKSPSSLFWLVIHGLCCLISLILGFRFSHLVLFFLFSTSFANLYTTPFLSVANGGVSQLFRLEPLETATVKKNSRVVVGRHGIRIRPWPHPNPIEVMKAHQLLARVQREQKSQFSVRIPKTVIAVTPTYVRTFQALHLTGVMHSLMLVPYDLIWIVVEAGGTTNETASFIAKSGLKTIHIGLDEKMPNNWEDRHKLETKMRLHALRIVREKKLDGIVMFADDSNMHGMELFDEIQTVKWVGALSIGILTHSGNAEQEKASMPIQSPSCDDSSQKLVGWHIFNSANKRSVLPSKMEWSGYVLNSRLLWKESVDDKPRWVKDFSMFDGHDDEVDSPLFLVKDTSKVEPLGSCGRHVLLWWLRAEARADSKFPPGWIINSPLEITVPSKWTPWQDSSSELRATERRSGKPRGSKKKGKHEPTAFDGIKVSTTR